MIRIRSNFRNALRGKALRLHNVDIWDNLAYRQKVTRVTKRIFYEYARRLKKIFGKAKRYGSSAASHRLSRKVGDLASTHTKLRKFTKSLPKLPMKMAPKGRRRRHYTPIGQAMKRRKVISLYFAGGRKTRRKQLRALNKKGRFFQNLVYRQDNLPVPKVKENVLYKFDSAHVPALLERRVSTLLARAHFVSSFQSRQWGQHGKILLNGKRVKRPDQIVKNYIPLTLNLTYRLKRKKEMTSWFEKGKACKFTTFPPVRYMFVDYVLFLIYCYQATGPADGRTHMYDSKQSGAFSSLSR